MPTTLLLTPPDFQTFLWPWYMYLLLPIPFCDQPLVALLVSLLLSRDTTLSIGGIGLTKVSIPLS